MKRKRSFKWGVILSAVGLLMVLLPALAYIYVTFKMGFIIFYLVMVIIIGGTFLLFGVLLLRMASRITPIRIYENGMEFPMGMVGKRTLFVPYGRILGYAESTLPM
ncbi:MAG: hypothetical protein J7L88_02115, partial [Thermoplasmata archaeon]|nr:hypothetical protein [Thermoplasmata archaeon]